MTVRATLILSLCLVCGLAQAKSLSKDEIKTIDNAIRDNDVTKVKSVLESNKTPFASRSDLAAAFSDRAELDPQLSGDSLLTVAMQGEPCRDEIAVALLEKGARVVHSDNSADFEKLVSIASANGCAKIVKWAVDHAPQDEIANASIQFFDLLRKEMDHAVALRQQGYESVESPTLKKLAPVHQVLEPFVIKGCPDKDKATRLCTAREKLDQMIASLKKAGEGVAQADKDREFLDSPEGMRKVACEIREEIEGARAEIGRQREIAKVSGTQDRLALHRAGERIVDLEANLKKIGSEYKARTGKNLPACR